MISLVFAFRKFEANKFVSLLKLIVVNQVIVSASFFCDMFSELIFNDRVWRKGQKVKFRARITEGRVEKKWQVESGLKVD